MTVLTDPIKANIGDFGNKKYPTISKRVQEEKKENKFYLLNMRASTA